MSDEIETISSRDMLEVALGTKDVDSLGLKGTGTFLDQLPKDVIQYLYHYTGPMDCYYLTNFAYDASGTRRLPVFHAWVNKTQQQASQEASNKGFMGLQISPAQVFFMEGKPYLIQQIDKRHLYGMPQPPKAKKAKIESTGTTTRCIGKTKSGKRCKTRTSNLVSQKCPTHNQ